MYFKLTKKEVTEQFAYILEFGYCDIQFIEPYLNQLGYTSGKYGWNSNIYFINNSMCISTGYRPFGNINGNTVFKNLKLKINNYFKDVKDYTLRKNYVNMLFRQLYCDLRDGNIDERVVLK